MLVPAQSNADISRHPTRKFKDLIADLIAFFPEMVVPEVIDFLGNARQRLFPAGLLLVDGASAVCAQRVRKAMDLDFGEVVAYRVLDNLDRERDSLLIGHARRLGAPSLPWEIASAAVRDRHAVRLQFLS